MAVDPGEYRGVVHGKVIELEEETGLPDGMTVTVHVQPAPTPGEGLRRSAGAWSDAGADLERWAEEMNLSRRQGRTEPIPAA